jgi:transposase
VRSSSARSAFCRSRLPWMAAIFSASFSPPRLEPPLDVWSSSASPSSSRFHITGELLVCFLNELGERSTGEVAVLVVDRLDARTVKRHELAPEQVELAAHLNEFPKYRLEGGTVVPAEIGDGLEVRLQVPQQPDDLDIAVGLGFQAPARANSVQVVFETGPLSVWFFHALTAEGAPAICIDARHAKAALDMAPNKTDANGADGLAQLAEVGFYREVRVKGYDSMLSRTLISSRTRLVRIGTELSNQIPGMMKTFGLLVPSTKGGRFHDQVRRLLADNEALARIILPVLEAWRSVRLRAAELGRQILANARQSTDCQLLMSIPGVGAITASSYVAAIEDPANFKKSRSVGAWFGLTTRRYQSGEVDYDGHISRRGDAHMRGLLYEAATVLLTRTRGESDLRMWGLKLREKLGSNERLSRWPASLPSSCMRC